MASFPFITWSRRKRTIHSPVRLLELENQPRSRTAFEQTRRNSRTRNLFIFLGRFFRVALEAVLTIGRFIRSPRTRLSPNDERDFDSSHATWANSLHHTVHAEKRNGWEEGGGEWVKRQLCGGEKRAGGAKGKRRRTNSVESRQRTIGGSLSPCIVSCLHPS